MSTCMYNTSKKSLNLTLQNGDKVKGYTEQFICMANDYRGCWGDNTRQEQIDRKIEKSNDSWLERGEDFWRVNYFKN